jgi:hypothetical protein
VQYAQDGGSDLVVPTLRSSPHVDYLDDDYNKDVLTGDTEGQILLYSNTGTDEAPVFSGYAFVDADGVPINLAGLARSRPYVCDWDNDGLSDLLVGADDGKIHLFRGIHPTGFISEERPPPPAVARLLDLYPNPFNPSVTVPFVLSEPQHVTITVYNATGRRVALVADRFYTMGEHNVTWRGVDDQAREVSSGVYFIRLTSGGTASTRRGILLR